MDDKKLAILEYLFIFDPADTWQHLYQFEDTFADYLMEHNMEAQVLDSINPKSGRRIIQIKARSGAIDELVDNLEKEEDEFLQEKPKSPGKILKDIRKGL